MHFRPAVEATLTGTSCTIEPAWTPHIPLGGSACGCSHCCCRKNIDHLKLTSEALDSIPVNTPFLHVTNLL